MERALEADQAKAEALKSAAAALAAEIATLRETSIAAAARAQDLEDEILETERDLDALSRQEAEKTARLSERRGQLARTLGALQRLALQPPEAALARSASKEPKWAPSRIAPCPSERSRSTCPRPVRRRSKRSRSPRSRKTRSQADQAKRRTWR